MRGIGVEFAVAHVSLASEIFGFGGVVFWEGCGVGCDANPRVGIGRSDTKVSSLIH